jgi:hypothetical protein
MSARKKWEQFLSPEVTRDRLISVSMYIAAFEMLKESIIGRIRDFYSIGINENGSIISSDYHTRVLSRNKSPLHASLDWLVESEAIEKSDLEMFERAKAMRNRLAHELPSMVLGEAEIALTSHFQEVFGLLKKIEVWWVVNVEIATNPDFDEQEIDEAGIIPGPVLMLQLMLEVVAGNEEFLHHYRAASPNATDTF